MKKKPNFIQKLNNTNKEPERKTQILASAIKIFGERGFQNATIAEIAKDAGVGDATIYEYFKNKEDLLFSIPEHRFKDHVNRLNEVFEIRTPLRKLRRLIRYHFLLYLTERDFLKVFLLHVQLNRAFYGSPVYETFRKYTEVIELVIEEGKKDGSIRLDVNPRVFRNLFLGAFSHMALRWLILDREAKTDKMEEIDEVVLLLSKAVSYNPEQIKHARDD